TRFPVIRPPKTVTICPGRPHPTVTKIKPAIASLPMTMKPVGIPSRPHWIVYDQAISFVHGARYALVESSRSLGRQNWTI
ncbi:hypothetical protein H0H92_003722, partial [Tricholoma furcatifolium]